LRADDIDVVFQRRPVPLIRLHVTGGLIFEITDPDLVVLGRSAIELLLPPDGKSGREAVISLVHIIWIEVVSPEE
jgi:hypothetical protein